MSSDVTQFRVSRLDEGQTYLFQVFAENDQGCGPALATQFETLAKDPFGKTSLFLAFCLSLILYTQVDLILPTAVRLAIDIRWLRQLVNAYNFT